ncbi:ROK family transcriptional regulator [Salinispira pacifica]
MTDRIAGYREGSKQFQRVANLALVMDVIRREQPLSRSDIARRLGLDRSTITHITSRLLSEGCIRIDSEGDAGSRGGRRPTLLAMEPDYGLTLGIDLTPGDCRAVAMNLGGEIRWRGGDPLDGYAREPGQAALEAVRRLVAAVEQSKSARSLIGVGIAVPGIVEPLSGTVLRSRALGMNRYDLRTPLADRTGLPVVIDNDARCCVYGELDGSGDSFLFLLGRFQPESAESGSRLRPSGMGIGVGLAVDGRVHSGTHHAAGEFRSMQHRIGASGQLGLPEPELRLMASDPAVLRRAVAEVLGNLIPVVSVIDPAEVVLGGEFRRRSDLVERVLSEELDGAFAWEETERPRFRSSRHGEWEVAAGAARMFLEQLFSVPAPAAAANRAGSGRGTGWEELFRRAAPEHAASRGSAR